MKSFSIFLFAWTPERAWRSGMRKQVIKVKSWKIFLIQSLVSCFLLEWGEKNLESTGNKAAKNKSEKWLFISFLFFFGAFFQETSSTCFFRNALPFLLIQFLGGEKSLQHKRIERIFILYIIPNARREEGSISNRSSVRVAQRAFNISWWYVLGFNVYE